MRRNSTEVSLLSHGQKYDALLSHCEADSAKWRRTTTSTIYDILCFQHFFSFLLARNARPISQPHEPVEYWLADGQISLHGDCQGHVDGGAEGDRRHRVEEVDVQQRESLKKTMRLDIAHYGIVRTCNNI